MFRLGDIVQDSGVRVSLHSSPNCGALGEILIRNDRVEVLAKTDKFRERKARLCSV